MSADTRPPPSSRTGGTTPEQVQDSAGAVTAGAATAGAATPERSGLDVSATDGAADVGAQAVQEVAPRTPWQMPEPPDREWVAALSDAVPSRTPLPEPPPVAAPPPPGRTLLIDDRGVFVRGPYRRPGAVAADGVPDGRGAGDADLPVALSVHGLAGNSVNFDVLGAVLADHAVGYAVDLPGHGRSDPPPGERYSLDDTVEVVAAVIERLSPGRPVHLLGNSLGGMVCVLLAARHPQLVRTLTLVSPAVPDLRMTTDRGADPRLGLVLLPGTTGPAVRRLSGIAALQRARGMAELCYGRPERLSDDEITAAAVELGWRFPLRWVHTSTISSLRALIRSYLQFPGRRFRSLTRRIAVPTLVVWGTRDRLVDCGLAPELVAGFPDAHLLALSDCGHVAMMERPEPTARAVLGLWQRAERDRAGDGDDGGDGEDGGDGVNAAGAPQGVAHPDVAPSTA